MGEHRRSKPRAKPRDHLRDVRFGILAGLAFATALSLWVALLALLQGSARFERIQLSVWQIIGTYFTLGMIGGVVFGLCRPVTNTRWGAVVIGSLIGVVAYTGVAISMGSGIAWSTLMKGVILGVPVGGAVGYRLYEA